MSDQRQPEQNEPDGGVRCISLFAGDFEEIVRAGYTVCADRSPAPKECYVSYDELKPYGKETWRRITFEILRRVGIELTPEEAGLPATPQK